MNPKLSVVIVMVSDTTHLEGCLTALSRQINPPPMEVIVPYGNGDTDVPALESKFPSVRFCPIENLRTGSRQSHERLDELRAAGLHLAQGEILAMTEDHGRPDLHWSANMVELHANPYAAVGGAIENEVDRVMNWAIYFCDFIRYQKPFPSGPSPYISDVNISYKRKALESIEEVWKDSFHETLVNDALTARGEILWLSPDIVLYQHRENLHLGTALRERYLWGRAYAGTRTRQMSTARRLLYAVLSPLLVFLLMARKLRVILVKRQHVGAFMKAFPLIALFTLVWSFGELTGYLTARVSAHANQEKQ